MKIKLLLLSENSGLAGKIRDILKRSGAAASVKRADCFETFLEEVRGGYDLAVCEHVPGTTAAHRAIAAARAERVPVVVVMDKSDYRAAIDFIREGAADCLREGELGMIAETMMRVADSRTSAELPLLEQLVESLPGPFLMQDLSDGSILLANRAAKDSGVCAKMSAESKFLPFDLTLKNIAGRGPVKIETVEAGTAGKERTYEIYAYPLFDAQNRPVRVIYHALDVTALLEAEREKQELTEQLLQAQKMESLGRLAGSIAHDFNNILTTIIGYSELIISEMPDDSSFREELNVVLETGSKAAELTKQLLAFSRKQVMAMQLLQPNAVIAKAEILLRCMIGEDVRLELELDERAPGFEGDPVQVEQVLMNLCINARDAVRRDGLITISTGAARIDEASDSPGRTILPGDYVTISVEDNGSGIPEEIRGKIFEPFFTTKEMGKGTGLGLATVANIVRQHKGFVVCESEVGKGTKFDCYFPAVPDKNVSRRTEVHANSLNGSETVLIAEDDGNIRDLLSKYLSHRGYKVVEASDALEALEWAVRNNGFFDVLLTDIIMPGMDGFSLARKLRERDASLPVIYMSGFLDEKFFLSGEQDENSLLIQKPLDLDQLASVLRSVLDRSLRS